MKNESQLQFSTSLKFCSELLTKTKPKFLISSSTEHRTDVEDQEAAEHFLYCRTREKRTGSLQSSPFYQQNSVNELPKHHS